MSIDYKRGTALYRALADETRVRIVHLLSSGELCACELLDHFDITQPTLSHHLGILSDAGIVVPRRDGKWTHYSLAGAELDYLRDFTERISREDERQGSPKVRRNCK